MTQEFGSALRQTIEARIWEVLVIPNPLSVASNSQNSRSGDNTAQLRLKMRTGIGGIERSIEAKAKETDENIALAFQDLNVLMAMAKDMVAISKVISTKIREQKGEISDDETVRFKSYLLSLGIEDPVTRENFSSNSDYFRSLAQQICELLLDPIEVRIDIDFRTLHISKL